MKKIIPFSEVKINETFKAQTYDQSYHTKISDDKYQTTTEVWGKENFMVEVDRPIHLSDLKPSDKFNYNGKSYILIDKDSSYLTYVPYHKCLALAENGRIWYFDRDLEIETENAKGSG